MPDARHDLTLADLVHDNVDLIEHATELLRAMPVRRLKAHAERAGSGLRLRLTTKGLDRVDASVGGRPIGSRDVRDGRVNWSLRQAVPEGALVELAGFDERKLVAALRCPVG